MTDPSTRYYVPVEFTDADSADISAYVAAGWELWGPPVVIQQASEGVRARLVQVVVWHQYKAPTGPAAFSAG